jgi:WD40 repeat protein
MKSSNFLGAALSRDGKVLVSWGQAPFGAPDKAEERTRINLTVQVWDVKTGKESGKIHVERRAGNVFAAAFSPDGNELAVGTSDGAVSFFDVASRKHLRTFQARHGEIGRLTYSPDGKLLVAGDGKFIVWDVKTGKRFLPPDGPLCRFIGLAFPPDGRVLASGQTGQALVLWDVLTGKALTPLGGHTASPKAIAFTRDGRRLHTAAADGMVATWRVHAGLRGKERFRQVAPTYHFRARYLYDPSFAFSPGLDYLARAAWSGGAQVLDLKTGQDAISAWSDNFQGPTLAFSPDGKTLALGRGGFRVDGSLERWRLASGKELPALKFPKRSVAGIAFSPDGQHIAIATHRDGNGAIGRRPELRVYLAATGKELPTFKPVDLGPIEGFVPLAYTPGGLHLVVTGHSELHFFDPLTGAAGRRLAFGGMRQPAPIFSADGRTVAVATVRPEMNTTGVALWELRTGRKRWEQAVVNTTVTALALSADGKMLASGHSDTTVHVWDITSRLLARPTERLAPGEADRLWTALAAADAAAAYTAMRKLATAPKEAVALIRKEVRPAGKKALGEAELIRPMRAIEVLEWIGSAEARAVLGALAKGDADAALTNEARRALDRVERPAGKED